MRDICCPPSGWMSALGSARYIDVHERIGREAVIRIMAPRPGPSWGAVDVPKNP